MPTDHRWLAAALGAALTAGLATSAAADPVYLNCGQIAPMVTIDVSTLTANGYQARVSAAAVEWDYADHPQSGGEVVHHWRVDRTTGKMTAYRTVTLPDGRVQDSPRQDWTCKRAPPPANAF